MQGSLIAITGFTARTKHKQNSASKNKRYFYLHVLPSQDLPVKRSPKIKWIGSYLPDSNEGN
jgi:hypothetical protein